MCYHDICSRMIIKLIYSEAQSLLNVLHQSLDDLAN
jgi:hypothetical protein